jgi:hypothetical protein
MAPARRRRRARTPAARVRSLRGAVGPGDGAAHQDGGVGPAIPQGAGLAEGGVEEEGEEEAHGFFGSASAASSCAQRSGGGRPRRSQVRE